MNKENFQKDFNIFFYGLMAFILVVFLISSRVYKKQNIDNFKKEAPKENAFTGIKNSNYNFLFTLQYRGKTYIYKGKRYKNKSLITYQEETTSIYFMIDDIVLEQRGKDYKISTLPFYKFNYFDNYLLMKLVASIKDSSLTNQMLDSIFKHKKIHDNTLNKVTIKEENKLIKTIVFDFTNYYQEEFILTLNYFNFGGIDDFTLHV